MALAGLNKLATASFFVRAVILAVRAAPTFPAWLCCCLPGMKSLSALCVTVALHGSTWERKANWPRFVKVHKNCFYIRRACYYFPPFYFLYLTYSMTLGNQKKSKYPWRVVTINLHEMHKSPSAMLLFLLFLNFPNQWLTEGYSVQINGWR